MSEGHPMVCDKALIVEEHGDQIKALTATVERNGGRIQTMEDTLYGPARNGGGFVKETRETLEIVRKGVETATNNVTESRGEIREVRAEIENLKGRMVEKPEKPKGSRAELVAAWARIVVPIIQVVGILVLIIIAAKLNVDLSQLKVLGVTP